MGNFGLGRKTIHFGIAGNGAGCNPLVGARVVCDFCGKRHTYREVSIEFMQHDVCPDCILSGPKEMARGIRKRIAKHPDKWAVPLLLRIAKRLEKANSLLEIECGIFALKIAEAYRELDNRPRARKGAAA